MPQPPPLERDLGLLLKKIQRERGLDCSQYKESYIKRRLAVRLRARGVDSYRAYSQMLDESEYDALLEALTINLTGFFRDPEVFIALRDQFLKPLLEERRRRGWLRFRAWSAGCASGEEPYSLAIMLHQLLRGRIRDWHITILGTDVDETRLAQARRGVYGPFSFRNARWPNLDHYFRTEEKGRAVSKEIKSLVRFRRLDLLKEFPRGQFDLILCRNVLIYFKRDRQTHIFSGFHRSLHRNGALVLGRSEMLPLEAADLFTALDSRQRIYQKQ